ncbi:MAG: queuosine salvage family protein [Candidatus Thorarchaeota archaeon]
MTVSDVQSEKLGQLLAELQPKAEQFLDPQLFPSTDYQPEGIVRFFFFVTGIDHRTSPPNQSFEGIVDGEYFQGADLLWHLSLRKFKADPHLFDPPVMAEISTETVKNWYTVHEPIQVTIRNPQERAALLRNSGSNLVTYYQGSVLNLLEAANHRITSDIRMHHSGLMELLSQFKAYEDPAEKKGYLFLKFILRRNLWSITDGDQVRIPVDNHLTRIALRTGIVNISPQFATHLRQQRPLNLETDVELRKMIAVAYSKVGEVASRSVLELDDFFWHFGRQCCLATDPICVTGCTKKCVEVANLLGVPCQETCPISSVCPASKNDKQRALLEPKLETWYY